MILLNMKKGLICLSIVAILMFCVPNGAVASTGNYSTTFHNNARHTGDHIPMARGSTSNGISNWNYVPEGILTSPATLNGIVYIGSWDHNVYRPQCEYRDEGVELHDRRLCDLLSHRRQRNRLRREL